MRFTMRSTIAMFIVQRRQKNIILSAELLTAREQKSLEFGWKFLKKVSITLNLKAPMFASVRMSSTSRHPMLSLSLVPSEVSHSVDCFSGKGPSRREHLDPSTSRQSRSLCTPWPTCCYPDWLGESLSLRDESHSV